MKIKLFFLVFTLMFACLMSINRVGAGAAITIESDGSIVPSTVPILRNGDRYVFTGNVSGHISVERDNIIIDGGGFSLKLSSACPVPDRNGITLDGRENVTVKNLTIDLAWYGILVKNCLNISVWGVTVTRSFHGGYLSYSTANRIVGNVLASNYHDGIHLFHSNNNTIWGNTASNNAEEGITLEQSSNNNVTDNILKGNLDGVVLIESLYNRIIGNNITSNTETGIWIFKSFNNIIHHNNFIDNLAQIYTFESCNIWDDDAKGNYWSNYGGFDNDDDGIGDASYIIGETNQDRYPFINTIPEFHNTLFLMLPLIGMLILLLFAHKDQKESTSN